MRSRSMPQQSTQTKQLVQQLVQQRTQQLQPGCEQFSTSDSLSWVKPMRMYHSGQSML
jgi:hypothetical protein